MGSPILDPLNLKGVADSKDWRNFGGGIERIKEPIKNPGKFVENNLKDPQRMWSGGLDRYEAPKPKPAPKPAAPEAPELGLNGAGGSYGGGGMGDMMSGVMDMINNPPGMAASPKVPTLTSAADKAKLLVLGEANAKSKTILTGPGGSKGPVRTRGMYAAGDSAGAEKLGKTGIKSILGG